MNSSLESIYLSKYLSINISKNNAIANAIGGFGIISCILNVNAGP